MIIYDPLYTSQNLRRGELAIARRLLAAGRLPSPWFIIALASDGNNELVIYPAYEVRSARVNRETLQVVGLAKGYFHALGLMTDIVRDVYVVTKDAALREWFLQRQVPQ